MAINLDLNEILSLDGFSGNVPIFPLSDVVLFPSILLPLHIFEDRYKKMLEDALANEKLISMVLLKPGWEKNYHDNPDVFDTSCLGRIISTEHFKDGRSNIILYGLKRVRILRFIESDHYRVAKVDIIKEKHDDREEIYRKHIDDLLLKWNASINEEQRSHKIEINTKISLDKLTDILSIIIVTNVFERQRLLEEIDPLKRAEFLINYLDTRLNLIQYTANIKERIIETRNLN